MAPKDAEVLATIATTETPVETITYQKFGEMELPEEEEVDDGDYIPSDADSEDSLEWSSETERTMAEDALAEGTVGLDFYNAAVSVATEYVASYAPVQMGLKVATVVPVASIQRAARAARRAGAKNIKVVERYLYCLPICFMLSVQQCWSFNGDVLGEHDPEPSWLPPCFCRGGLFQACKTPFPYDISVTLLLCDLEALLFQHLKPGTEPFTPEQEFSEMTLSDYDSDEDADYLPSETDEESDELEYDSDVSVSSGEEEENVTEEIWVNYTLSYWVSYWNKDVVNDDFLSPWVSWGLLFDEPGRYSIFLIQAGWDKIPILTKFVLRARPHPGIWGNRLERARIFVIFPGFF